MHISPIFLMNNVENPRITEWTSTNVERSHRLPHVYTKMMYGKLGGYRLQEKYMIYLTPEPRLYFLVDQAIWGGATGRSALQISSSPLPACTASLLASHLYTATLLRALQLPGRTNPNAMALSSSPAGTNLCQKECQKNASLPIYLPIYLSVCLSVYLTS